MKPTTILFRLMTVLVMLLSMTTSHANNSASSIWPRAMIIADPWNGTPVKADVCSIASQNLDSKCIKYTGRSIASFPAFPVFGLPSGNRIVIADAAKAFIEANVATYASQVATKLRAENVSQGIIDITRRYSDSGGNARRLSFSVFVASNGKYVYGAPMVHDGEPEQWGAGVGTKVVEALYVPVTPRSGVPANWRWDPANAAAPFNASGLPAASEIRYRVITLKEGTVIQDWTTVSVGTKVYDLPDSGDGSWIELSMSPNCLLDQSYVSPTSGASCPKRDGKPFVDLRTLMGATDAKLGFLDFLEPMRPWYTASGTTAGTANASIMVNVNSRSIYRRCDASNQMVVDSTRNPNYEESGTYRYTLDRKITRYMMTQLKGQVYELGQSQDALTTKVLSYSVGAVITDADVATLIGNGAALTQLGQWRTANRFPEGQPTWGTINYVDSPCAPPTGGAASITITKNVDDPAAVLAWPTISVQAACTISGVQSVNFIPPSTGTISGLTSGERCTLTETAITGGTLASGKSWGTQTWNINGFLLAAGVNPVTVTNTTNGGSTGGPGAQLIITKDYSNPLLVFAHPTITAQAVCSISGTRSVTFTPPATGTITGLTVGETCTVTETAVTGGTLASGYVWTTITVSPPGAFVMAATSNVSVTNTAERQIDVCSNIAGNQATVPFGMFRDAATNNCYAPSTGVNLCACGPATLQYSDGTTATNACTQFDAFPGPSISTFTGSISVYCTDPYIGNNNTRYVFSNGSLTATQPLPGNFKGAVCSMPAC